jgi:SapC
MGLVELSRSAHSGLRIRPDLVEAAVAEQHLVPLINSEFRKASSQYPIVFAKHPDTGQFGPYALNGLGLKENLFWSGTELEVAYVPLNVRRLPFYVGTDNALCIDLDHPSVAAAGGKSLVNPDGSDSPYLKGILSILGELVSGRPRTEQFIATLLSLELLAPIVLDIALDDKTPLQLEGLYSIDEDRFRQLDEREIGRLWNAGYLDLIYSVLLSTGQIFRLIRLKNQRMASSRAWHSLQQ